MTTLSLLVLINIWKASN